MAFFGLSVKGNANSEFEIPQGAMLTITQISLADAKDGEAATVSLAVEIEGFDEDAQAETKTFQVARLIAGKTDQLKVNFKLFCHEPSSVSVKGAGTVHLVGYFEPDPNFPDDDEDMDEEEEALLREQMMAGEDDEEDEEEETPAPPAKKAQPAPAKAAPAKATSPAPAKPQQQQQNAGMSKNQKKKEKQAQKRAADSQENGQKKQKMGGSPAQKR